MSYFPLLFTLSVRCFKRSSFSLQKCDLENCEKSFLRKLHQFSSISYWTFHLFWAPFWAIKCICCNCKNPSRLTISLPRFFHFSSPTICGSEDYEKFSNIFKHGNGLQTLQKHTEIINQNPEEVTREKYDTVNISKILLVPPQSEVTFVKNDSHGKKESFSASKVDQRRSSQPLTQKLHAQQSGSWYRILFDRPQMALNSP